MTWCLIVGGLVLGELIAHVVVARIIVAHFERTATLRAVRYRPLAGAQSFAATTHDGVTLQGSIIPTTSPVVRGVVVYCHEFSGNRWSCLNYCREDAVRGCDVVAFDFRNLGDSGSFPGYRPMHWASRHEASDVLAVLDRVRSQPRWRDVPIVLVGVSRGATAAALAAAERPDIAGLVAIGAFSTHELALIHFLRGIARYAAWALRIPRWHIRATLELGVAWSGWRRGVRFPRLEPALARRARPPRLFIAGDVDGLIPTSVPRALHSLSGPAAELWIVPGARHNQERDADPQEFDFRLARFLQRSLGSPCEVETESADALAAA